MTAYIGFDWDGTLVSNTVTAQTHKAWFAHYAEILDDQHINDLATTPEAFLQPVLEVMSKVHGRKPRDENEEARYLHEAREAYKQLYLELVARHPKTLNDELVALARRVQHEGHELALLTGKPTTLIHQVLALHGLSDLFAIIQASPQEEYSSKTDVFNAFSKKHPKARILCYIGDEPGDEEACRTHDVPFLTYEERGTTLEAVTAFVKAHMQE